MLITHIVTPGYNPRAAISFEIAAPYQEWLYRLWRAVTKYDGYKAGDRNVREFVE